MIGGPGIDTIDGGADGGKSVYSGSQLAVSAHAVMPTAPPFGLSSDLRPAAPDGKDTLSNVQFLEFTDTNIDLRAVRNFDGLHRSDFAWQHDGGHAAIWLMHGTGLTVQRRSRAQFGTELAYQGHRRLQRGRPWRFPLAGRQRPYRRSG